MMRVLIVDDETYARRGLRLLLEQASDVEIVGDASTGKEAVAQIARTSPDLVLLDIQMPDMSGFDVLARVPPSEVPLVIFVTAYDEFAIDAFDASAIDYLLKPVADERFHQSLDRARAMLHSRSVEGFQEKVRSLLQQMDPEQMDPAAPATRQEAGAYLDRISVGAARKQQVIEAAKIAWIEAQSYYAALHVGPDVFLVRSSLSTLAERLDPGRFIRIHRSTIVNIDYVDKIEVDEIGEQWVRLTGGPRRRISRAGRKRLDQRIDRLS